MIIDIGSNNYYVCGVITQGSGSADYWVNTFEVDFSEDNSNYAPIAGTYTTAGDKTTQKLSRFPLPMRARYIRIWPSTVNGALAMRAGLVTCGPLRAGTSGNHATNAGVTCHSDVSNCGTQITDGSKCTDSTTFSGAVATASTELCTSKYWVQLDLGATLSNNAPTKLVNKVVVYGCQNLMYCGRALEVSSDGTTWSTVYEANTAYDDDDTPNVTYSAVESGSGSVFRFDLRPIRYVKVWSSISSSALQVHFAEIEVYEQATELNYQFDTEMASTAVTMGKLSNLGMLSDYTFMAYWKASSLTTNAYYPIFGQTQSSGLNFFVKQTATNTVQLEHKADGSDGCSTSATSVSANWNHVTLSFTASTKASTFYLNGAAVSPTCAAQISATDGSVEYGGGRGEGTWSGSLQQAKVYTRTVLSEDLTNFSNWCSTYTCGPGYRRDSSKSGTCSTASCTDAECCEEWPTCATTDCTQDSKYTSRRRNYCFRSCTETLCCTWRVLGSFTLTGTSTPTVTTHSTASWVDAGSTCKDQFDDALPVTTSGTVDRTTAGTYTITYQCTENNGNTVLDTKTRTVTVVESMYINPALYWVVQREAGSWTDTVSKCWDTADTFDADVADMHQSETWDASARLYNADGASGGVTEENRTITYTCSLTSEKIERTLMIRDAIRLYGPNPHVVRSGRLRWNAGACEICDTTDTNPGETSCSYSDDNSTTTDRCALTATGWKASNDKGEGTYLQLDLGSALKVAGVKTKGHSSEEAWLKTYTVAYSTDGSSWNDVSGTFTANTDQNTEVEAMLPSIVEAQWWRIIAKTFHNVVAARAAIMVCSSTSTSTDADCLCGYVAAPAAEACRTDVTVDCIDATGTAQTPSLSPSIIKALDASETVVTYSCTGAPDYTRTVKIRDSISLVGSSSVLVPAGVSGQWNVASSGTFYETGSTCITHEGEELTPSVDLDYLPFTTERTYIINYECRRRAAPVLQRTVEVRFPHRFENEAKKVWALGTELGSSATHYEDAWACMDLTATAQSSSRLPVSSDFFDRYIENYVSYPFLPCSTGVPLIVRSGEIRHPIFLAGDRQEFHLGISSSGTPSLGQSDFDTRFAASPFRIIRRTCSSCDAGFQDIYYRRLTDMPSGFSAYKQMACEWTETDNKGGTDFKIYSSLADAIADTNAWSEYGGFGSTDVGFPGTSGPSSASSGQYSSIPLSECSSSSTATGVDGSFYLYDYASSVVPGTCTRSVGTLGSGAQCEDDNGQESRLGFLMFTKESRAARWQSTATSFAENFVCARFTGVEWQYLEGTTWTQFIPYPTDVLLARIEFDNNTITSLKGSDEEFYTVKMGFVDGDLDFTLGTSSVTIVGTSFVARCGEDLWCRGGVRPSGTDGASYCCASSCTVCGGATCSDNGALDICCLSTLLEAGRVCRDHDDVSCLVPESSVLCGGSLQLNNFESAATMKQAGWTIDSDNDADLFSPDSTLNGWYRGFASGSNAGGISVTLRGFGQLDLTYGNGNSVSGTTNQVQVLLGGNEVDTADSTQSAKTATIDFTDGDVLEIKDAGDAMILVKGLAFKCLVQDFWPRVVIKSGEFGAPSTWTAWPAEACYLEEESTGTWSGTVSVSSSSISTASEGLFPVTYTCSRNNIPTTRTVIVKVRDPIELVGLEAMIVRQSAGSTLADPGAACIDRDLVPLAVSTSPSSIALDNVGEYSFTYSCTDSSSRTSTKIRYVQVAPAIELKGDAVIVIEKDKTWNDPGVQCVDVNGGLLAHTASPSPVDTTSAATNTVTYTCTDSTSATLTATRTVIVTSGLPGTIVQGPSSGIVLLLGETFQDPGVCCKDSHNQVLPFSSILNTAHSDWSGLQTLFYSCTSFDVSESAVRTLTVNNVPKIFLTGDAETLSVLDNLYVEAGAVCTDIEDGLITAWGATGLGNAQKLPVLRAGASGTVTSGAAENIIDGDEASSVTQACESCVEVPQSVHLWVDLGAGKVVHQYALAGTVSGASILVGPDINVGPACKTGITTSLGSSSIVDCDAPLAGRFVTLVGSASSMKVCELTIYGTVGPAAPARINITGTPASCTGVDAVTLELAGHNDSALGVMYSTQLPGSNNELRTDLGTGPHLQTEAVAGKTLGTPGSERWVLRDSKWVEQAYASGGESFPPLDGSQWTISGSGATCTGLSFAIDPEDSCSWLFGPSSADDQYGCGDGSECNTEGCCSTAGGLARCPPNLPRMCEAKTCGSDYCCKTDCASHSGNRLCKQSSLPAVTSTGSSTLARMEVVNSVLPNDPAIYKVTYTCYDSAGAHVSVTRTVEVGCEDPNPGGTYGGNRVACSTIYKETENVANYDACETLCLSANSTECVAYSFFTNGTCQFLTLCTGRYFMIINGTDRHVAYCRRVDTAPSIYLEDGVSWFLLGATTYSLPKVSCSDSEDAGNMGDPTDNINSVVDVNTAGNYIVTYTCTDSAGQSTTGTRTVTVKANCSVPTVVNQNSTTGYCVEGTTFAHGTTCTGACNYGYAPRNPTHTCTTKSDTDYESAFDPSLILCDVLPCNEPSVANSAVSPTDGQPKACEESNTAREIPDSSVCTPQCADGYVPRVPGVGSGATLACSAKILDPPTFVCELPAAPPLSIFAPSRPKPEGAVDITLQFATGTANDCAWSGFIFEGKEVKSGETTTYGEMVGCENSIFTARDVVTCMATGLTEGGDYQFRVMEVCTDTNMNSPWTESEVFTLRFVIVPDILLLLPEGDQYSAVSQVLLAMQVDVYVTSDTSKAFVIDRKNIREGGEVWCPTIQWRVPADSIIDGSPSGASTVGLIQERILIANFPADDFIKPGDLACISHGSNARPDGDRDASMISLSKKVCSWNFSYIDPSPVRKVLQVSSQEVKDDGIEVTFLVQYDLASEINCTVAAVEPDAAPLRVTGRVGTGALRQPIYSSDINRTAGEYTVFDDTAFSFSVPALVPSKQYTINCDGWKRSKPWVPVVCSNFPEACPDVSFTTLADTRADLQSIGILKVALCADGTQVTMSSEIQTFAQVATGIVMLLSQHERVCGVEKAVGEVADTEVNFTVAPVSDFATMTYNNPEYEYHNFSYEKQADGARLLMLTSSLDVTVCSHAHSTIDATTYPCTNYAFNVSFFNVSFTDTKLAILKITVTPSTGASYSVEGAGSEIMARNGDLVTFDMEKDPVTQLTDINVSLGGSTFFPQVTSVPSEFVMTTNIEGQGLSLPVKMKMSGVDFDMEYKITFHTPTVTPQILTPTLTASGQSRNLMTVLDNVPTTASAIEQVSNPADFIRLSLRKVGEETQEPPGFCEQQIFSEGWTKLDCVVTLTPLKKDSLVLEIQVKNFTSTLWQLASDFSMTGQVDFQAPTVTGLFTRDASGAQSNGVLVEQVMTSDPVFYLQGQNFASLMDLSLTYVDSKIYQLWLVLDRASNSRLLFCSSVEYVSDTELKCLITSCLDARNVPAAPEVVLQIGDLESTSVIGQLTLPQPQISIITPAAIFDAGYSEIEIEGVSFGEFLAADGDFQAACLSWQTKLSGLLVADSSRRLSLADQIPALQMLGTASVTVGLATCTVQVQNNSYVKCSMTSPRRASREAPAAGELLGRIISENVDVNVILKVGSLEEMNKPVLPTQISQCEQEGYYRPSEDSDGCEPCPKGTYSNRFSDQWPLGCTFCPSTSYQDQVGQTACLPCPANTFSVPPAVSLEDCRCKKGYFSPVYDASQTYGKPGYACVACHTEDFTTQAMDDEPCSVDVQGTLCDEPVSQVCVPRVTGSFDYRLCMIYCAGGTMLPLAKPYFYISKAQAATNTQNPGAEEYKPVIESCLPSTACLNGNQCNTGYEGPNCGACVFGYFQDPESNVCTRCGEDQVLGTLIFSALGMCGTFGAFFLSLLYLKMLSDPIFKGQIKLYIARKIVDRMKAALGGGGGGGGGNPLMKMIDKFRFKRVTLIIRKQDIAGYWPYFQNKDLGFVFRVDKDRTIHVAGVRPGSPASRLGISHSWRLLVLNGKHLRADTDVQDALCSCKLPIYCLFRAPRAEKSDDEAELDTSDAKELSASGVRLITMSLSIMQSFNGIGRIDLEWPELFTKIMAVIANLSFNFNFFQPDCSVESPYWQNWVMFTIMPYALMFPITCSYLVVKYLSFRESRGDPQYREVQGWLLLNAWGRAMLTILLLFIQQHMTQLSIPFQCKSMADGSQVLVASQDIVCDLADTNYQLLFGIASLGWFIFGSGFAVLNVCLYWSYHWQAGTKTRDRIPIYVAAVEMSVENMRGWVEAVRLRVFSNIVAVRTYPTGKDTEAAEKRQLMEAKMKQRGAAVVPDNPGKDLNKELADMRRRKATLEDEVNLKEIKLKWKNKERFTEKGSWPDQLDGSYLTYGWVLIFSSFFRQFALMLSALMAVEFPPFGAAAQSLVFMINFAALILLFPYTARLLNIEESVLTGCMAFLTFMAAFKEMVSKHNKASQYQSTIDATSSLIDVLVLIIVTIISGTMVFNAYIIIGGAVTTESDDQILNKAYFETAMQQEWLREEEERGRFHRQMEEEARDEEDAHEAAFWNDPLQAIEKECIGLKLIPLPDSEATELDKCISSITSPFVEELREKRDAFESTIQQKKEALKTREQMEAEELRQMRWEEYRQKKADIFWAAQEAEERNAMFHEDPQRLHEAFMQEALQLAERYERDCMERVEREQREVEEWNANLEAAERVAMAEEDLLSFEEPELRARELRDMAKLEFRQREVEETNARLEAMFLDMMQKEEQRQREVEEWNSNLEAQAQEAMEREEELQREYDEFLEISRLQIEKDQLKKLRKDELKRMQKEEKIMRKYLQSILESEELELSRMASEEQRTRQVEELASRLEMQNLDDMRWEEQRQKEIAAYLAQLENEERHGMAKEEKRTRKFRKKTQERLVLVLDRAGMEVNDLRVQEHAAKTLQRERTRMAQEDEEAKEQRARDRIRLEIEEEDRKRRQAQAEREEMERQAQRAQRAQQAEAEERQRREALEQAEAEERERQATQEQAEAEAEAAAEDEEEDRKGRRHSPKDQEDLKEMDSRVLEQEDLKEMDSRVLEQEVEAVKQPAAGEEERQRREALEQAEAEERERQATQEQAEAEATAPLQTDEEAGKPRRRRQNKAEHEEEDRKGRRNSPKDQEDLKEMDSQALEQEAEAAELAGGEACEAFHFRGPMMCGTFFPGIDWVVQEAAGKAEDEEEDRKGRRHSPKEQEDLKEMDSRVLEQEDLKEMDSQALEQEAEAAELAGGEEAAGKSKRRRRKKAEDEEEDGKGRRNSPKDQEVEEMDSQALEQEAEAAELAGGEEAAGKSRRRRRKKSEPEEQQEERRKGRQAGDRRMSAEHTEAETAAQQAEGEEEPEEEAEEEASRRRRRRRKKELKAQDSVLATLDEF
eukprot:s2756_g1.t2